MVIVVHDSVLFYTCFYLLPNQKACSSCSSSPYRQLQGFSGFRPSASIKRSSDFKSFKSKKMKAEVQWSREVTCLRFKDQKRIPDPDERIKLATMGLSNKLIMFNMSGDSSHIHEEILNAFPTLKDCGGSNLLRQGKGYHLIVLDPPNGGYTVKFLADVLNRAKLFVRPLQRDLTRGKIIASPRVVRRTNDGVITRSTSRRYACNSRIYGTFIRVTTSTRGRVDVAHEESRKFA